MPDKSIPKSTTESIPYGYCHCGCGEKTSIAKKTCNARGRIKGEPYRFCRGHNTKMNDSVFRHSYGHRAIKSQDMTKWDNVLCCYKVPLTKGKFALVDRDDLPLVQSRQWQVLKARYGWYARSGGGSNPTVMMHRAIACPPTGMVVHHINGDGLDNRRENLQVCTPRENSRMHVNGKR